MSPTDNNLGSRLPGTAEPQLGTRSHPGTAEPQLGSSHRGWYNRGRLPHYDAARLLQAITYHLADSLPAAVLARIQAEIDSVPAELQDTERRKRLDAWLDAGHGSCALRHSELAACVVDTWQRFVGERYDLLAWVVMPNHVHVLISVYRGMALGKIVQSWKSYTGRRIQQFLEEEEEADCRAGARRSQDRSQTGAVWMREYWDRAIRDERHFLATLNYIHANPVKAGLVAAPEDWQWSSAWRGPDAPLGSPSPSSALDRAPQPSSPNSAGLDGRAGARRSQGGED